MSKNVLTRSSIVKSETEVVTQETAPLLHGDRVTDDTEAVQWYFDHGVPLPDPPEGGGYFVRPRVLRIPPGAELNIWGTG